MLKSNNTVLKSALVSTLYGALAGAAIVSIFVIVKFWILATIIGWLIYQLSLTMTGFELLELMDALMEGPKKLSAPNMNIFAVYHLGLIIGISGLLSVLGPSLRPISLICFFLSVIAVTCLSFMKPKS